MGIDHLLRPVHVDGFEFGEVDPDSALFDDLLSLRQDFVTARGWATELALDPGAPVNDRDPVDDIDTTRHFAFRAGEGTGLLGGMRTSPIVGDLSTTLSYSMLDGSVPGCRNVLATNPAARATVAAAQRALDGTGEPGAWLDVTRLVVTPLRPDRSCRSLSQTARLVRAVMHLLGYAAGATNPHGVDEFAWLWVSDKDLFVLLDRFGIAHRRTELGPISPSDASAAWVAWGHPVPAFRSADPRIRKTLTTALDTAATLNRD